MKQKNWNKLTIGELQERTENTQEVTLIFLRNFINLELEQRKKDNQRGEQK